MQQDLLFIFLCKNRHFREPANPNQSYRLPYPDLQFYALLVPVDGFHFEVDAHCADEGWRERVICVAEQEGGLAHAAVPNDQDLKHVIKVLIRGLLLPISRICS